ncbi:MAG: hypothetical protein WC006_01705 [Bacilli bacterium]|nr:hypothetical protein [Bacilli bacterium]
MIKVKFIFIIILGLVSFIYNLLSGDLLDLIKNTDYVSLIDNHLGLKSSDSFIGILFDYFISILFNFNIKEFTSIFKLFGG